MEAKATFDDLRVVPFRRWHYEWLTDSNPTADGGSFIAVDGVLGQLETQNSWTGVVEGNPIACAGTIQQWRGRHTAWAYLGKNTAPYMVWITKQARIQLDKVTGRIEFTVRADFPAGQKWAGMLGFEVETPCMKGYGPEGESHVGYVRFN